MPDGSKGRDIRLDFFRGIALWMIFANHIPNNPLSLLATRRYGFSDGAELFVFVSGCTAGLVYGRRALDRGLTVVRKGLVRRVWLIYRAQLAIALAYIGLAVAAAFLFDRFYWNDEHLSTIFAHPVLYTIKSLALVYQPSMVRVLPLYIIVLIQFALLVPWVITRPLLVLGASAALYLAVQMTGFGGPSEDDFYFNPLAWQLLFMTGATLGIHRPAIRQWFDDNIVIKRTLTVLSAGYLLFSLAVIILNHVPSLQPLAPFQADPDARQAWKANLGPLRLAHILAVAYLAIRFIPPAVPWMRSRIAAPINLCGRNSLWVFCLSTLLSYIGWVITRQFGTGLSVFIPVNIAGIALMIAAAAAIETVRASGFSPGQTAKRLAGGLIGRG